MTEILTALGTTQPARPISMKPPVFQTFACSMPMMSFVALAGPIARVIGLEPWEAGAAMTLSGIAWWRWRASGLAAYRSRRSLARVDGDRTPCSAQRRAGTPPGQAVATAVRRHLRGRLQRGGGADHGRLLALDRLRLYTVHAANAVGIALAIVGVAICGSSRRCHTNSPHRTDRRREVIGA